MLFFTGNKPIRTDDHVLQWVSLHSIWLVTLKCCYGNGLAQAFPWPRKSLRYTSEYSKLSKKLNLIKICTFLFLIILSFPGDYSKIERQVLRNKICRLKSTRWCNWWHSDCMGSLFSIFMLIYNISIIMSSVPYKTIT